MHPPDQTLETPTAKYYQPPDKPENLPIVFLRRKQVEKRTGLSRSSIYLAMSRGDFPKNVQIGAKVVVWVDSEITRWMQDKIDKRPQSENQL